MKSEDVIKALGRGMVSGGVLVLVLFAFLCGPDVTMKMIVTCGVLMMTGAILSR